MSKNLVQHAYHLVFEFEKHDIDTSNVKSLITRFLSGSISEDKFEELLSPLSDYEVRIKNIVAEEDNEEDALKSRICESFLSSCASKPFLKEISKFLSSDSLNECSDLSLSKAFSSFLTHILIESEKEEESYIVLEATALSFQIHEFLSGSLSLESMKTWLLETYPSLWKN